jgi:hypothetical protein
LATKKSRPAASPTEASPAVEETITTYKGFGPDWKCRDFQYEIGKSYENPKGAEACAYGFHACEHPLNVFDYYAPAGSKFAVVEQSGKLSRHDGDTKVASSKISIKCEIDFAGLVKAAIEYVVSRCEPIDPASPASATGYQGAASATGDQGAASATGTRGAASATGTRGAASATGYQGAASATGDQGAASATGDQGAASATGDQGAAMASGYEGRACGIDGTALFLVFRDDNWSIVHAKAAIVGRDGIKANVFYQLNAAGEFVEAE